MRFGLFGGTFNPVHIGHLRSALEVREGFDLQEVFLIPAALPPHKTSAEVVDADDRLRILTLALEDTPGLSVSDVELKRSGPSYTIDTVRHFINALPDKSQLYLIMGLDTFLEIDSWKSYEQVLIQIPIIVMDRPGAGGNSSRHGWQVLDEYLKSTLSNGYRFSQQQSCYLAQDRQPVYTFGITALDISSTMIRGLLKKGRSIGYLVPRRAAEFINSRGLYL